MSSDKEKLSIPLEPQHQPQSKRNFSVFLQKIKRAVFFYLLRNPAETPYLSVRDGKLFNAVRLVEFRSRKVAVQWQFTPFWGGPKPVFSDGLRAGTIESHNFFCLRSYPGEISHSNSPNWELSNDIWDVVVRRRKVAIHTFLSWFQAGLLRRTLWRNYRKP